MTDRLGKVIAQVFNLPENSLPENPGADNLDEWDSLGQLRLIMAVEKEFGVHFPSDSMASLISKSAFEDALARLFQSGG